MRRREFIGLVGGAAAAWPLAARAQRQNGLMARIAILGASSPQAADPHNIEQFKRGLEENSLVEGRNVTVDYVWAEGSLERLGELAADLAQRNLDVIVTAGPQPIRALLAAGIRIPIVLAIHTNPVGDGIVESLARPGGT
jgi:putative ABC transport system substrate-binding protein